MTYETQDNAIRTRFDGLWTGGSNHPVAYPNAEFVKPTNSPWLQFVMQDAGANQVSMGDPGNNFHRHTGLLTVMIFTPLNQGDAEALQIADEVGAIFRGWQDPTTKVFFRLPPFVRRIGAESKWYHVNLLCPFERDSLF